MDWHEYMKYWLVIMLENHDLPVDLLYSFFLGSLSVIRWFLYTRYPLLISILLDHISPRQTHPLVYEVHNKELQDEATEDVIGKCPKRNTESVLNFKHP